MKAMHLKVVLLAAVLGLSACKGEKHRPEDKAVVDSSEIRISEKSTPEELVSATEQLVNPYTFMVAYKIADMAVKKDSKNLKAKFYALLLKRFEAFRGIATRIRPSLKAEELKSLDAEMAQYPDSALRKFLVDNGPEIKNEADMQKVVEDYYAAVGELHKFLKENENIELELNFNPFIFQQPFRKELAAAYKVEETESGMKIKVDKTLSKPKRINIADMIVMRQAAGAELLSGLFTYSYDISGLAQLRGQSFGNDERILNALFATEAFGKLKENHGFAQLPAIGSDLSAAAAWVLKFQGDLCPRGSSETRSKFLIDNLCVKNPDEPNKALALLNNALKGAIELDVLKDEENIKVKVDLFNLSKNPIKDLRSIKPNFNAAGCADSFADNTLGGVFVDNNANSVLLKCEN